MNKKALSETDIRTKFITPAICGPDGAGWDVMTQVREEAFFTKGRVAFGQSRTTRQCTSRGLLESAILGAVRSGA